MLDGDNLPIMYDTYRKEMKKLMQTKDVTKLLGINRDRIKYFKKQGVFMQTSPPDYSDGDLDNLKRLSVLTKAGLTCDDIKKVQMGDKTLNEVIHERRQIIKDKMNRMQGSLHLSEEMLNEGIQYNTMRTEYFWNEIQQRERSGEEFIDIEADDFGISLVRTVTCPACKCLCEIDLKEYLWDETCNESTRDDDMGPDIVYSFDSEDDFECRHCNQKIRVKGWIREYPLGGYDSEGIEVNECVEQE